jgi:hypothetical protein
MTKGDLTWSPFVSWYEVWDTGRQLSVHGESRPRDKVSLHTAGWAWKEASPRCADGIMHVWSHWSLWSRWTIS